MMARRRNSTNVVKTAAKAVAETMDKRTQNLLVGALSEDAGYVRVDSNDIKRAIFGPLITDGGMRL